MRDLFSSLIEAYEQGDDIPEPEAHQARKGHPETFHESARITAALGRQTQLREALRIVEENPYLTAGELSRIYAGETGETDSRTIPRYLRHLERVGLIHEGGTRPDRQTGRRCIVWARG